MSTKRLELGSIAFEDDAVYSIRETLSASLVGDELAIDKLDAEIMDEHGERMHFITSDGERFITSDGKTFTVGGVAKHPDRLPAGTVCRLYVDGALKGKYYLEEIVRTATDRYSVTAQSAIGLLANQKHYGGLYTGETFPEVAAEILGGTWNSSTGAIDGGAMPCSVQSGALTALRVYGHLPIAPRRDNLHALLFSTGAMLVKDSGGDPRLILPEEGAAIAVGDDEIFLGGSVSHEAPCLSADITEHSYIQTENDTEVVLFDNHAGNAASTANLVEFKTAPCYGLSTTGGLRILEGGVNYAVVQGIGTLKGKPYTHATRLCRVGTAGTATATVEDAGLANALNSANIAERVLAYYGTAKRVSADLVMKSGIIPGARISFTDPFGDPASALIETMSVRTSGIRRASCDLALGYQHGHTGNRYDTSVLLTPATQAATEDPDTGRGVFQIPAGVTELYAILLSGGSGGDGGQNGTDATDAIRTGSSNNGKGGAGGSAGESGRVYSALLNVRGLSSIRYSCGHGGAGGTSGGGSGAAGGDTIFGAFSTAQGASGSGVMDLITGNTYGTAGTAGVAGADGGEGGSVTFGGVTWYNGATGATMHKAPGGFGGGAAVGSNGADGGDGKTGSGGDGGSGANANDGAAPALYAQGGNGGHGGGGGGAAARDKDGFYGAIGTGGSGGAGGNGGDGCIIIYYKEAST